MAMFVIVTKQPSIYFPCSQVVTEKPVYKRWLQVATVLEFGVLC